MLNRLLNMFLLLMLSVSQLFAQSPIIKGVVRDANTDMPIVGAVVRLADGQMVTTDADGRFELPKHGEVQIVEVQAVGYVPQQVDVLANGAELQVQLVPLVEGATAELSEVVVSSDDLGADGDDQAVSGLLLSSADAFAQAASFNFGAANFRVRGYGSEYNGVLMNGLNTNDMESGYSSWSAWGGLNDATRNQTTTNGMAPSAFAFGGLGGTTAISTRPSEARVQTRLSYASANTTYRHRVMFTHTEHKGDSPWAYTITGSRRWAKEGYVEGTNYDAWALLVAVERQLNSQQSMWLTLFAAPTRRAMQGVSSDEARSLVGDNFYNPNWGYQNGEKRSARVRYQHKPTATLNHRWISNDGRLVLNSVLGYSWSTYQTTSLNWYDAQDPRPDYYRKLPSYWAETSPQSVVDAYTDAFSNDAAYSQINWDALYQVNYGNVESDGQRRSKYAVENRITDAHQVGLSSVVNYKINNSLQVDGGINLQGYAGKNYKQMTDLLGGDYWLDIDQYAERDFGGTDLVQNDLDAPDRKISEGDNFGYSYTARVNRGNLWAVGSYRGNRAEAYLGANYSYTEFWRHGNMRNGRFPEHSKGASAKQRFNDYGLKAGGTWKISGRHYLSANLAYMTKAPEFRNAYISVRTSDFTIDGLRSEQIASADLNYHLRMPVLKLRLSAYYTLFMDQAECYSFYDDNSQSFVNFAMRGINKAHRGFELGAEFKATASLTLNAAAAVGRYQYTSRPLATVTKDNLGTVLMRDETIYLKNYYVANTPQTAASLGLNYAAPRYIYIGASVSYFNDIYLGLSPGKRTEGVLVGFDEHDPARKQITQQLRADQACLLNASIGKTLRIKRKYFMNFNLQVNNLLNNTNFRVGGYEQSRYPKDELLSGKFPPKYYYAYGRTYYLIIGIRL